MQETLLGAYRDFATFQGDSRKELHAWLRKILANNLAVFRRRYRHTRKRQVGIEIPIDAASMEADRRAWASDVASPSSHAANREQAEALLAALARVPEEYRRVIVWHQYDQHTFEEIGRRLERSAEAAAEDLVCALLRLTEELRPDHDSRA